MEFNPGMGGKVVNLFYRFIIFIMSIILMLVSLLTAIYAFGFARVGLLPDIIESMYKQWQAGIVFLLLFIAGAWIIYPFFIREVKTTPISRSDLGEVDITIEALDNLVNSVALQQEGIAEISNKMLVKDEGLFIFLQGKVSADTPIPELTADLQMLVKSYIEDTTGVNVAGVKVLIKGVSNDQELVK